MDWSKPHLDALVAQIRTSAPYAGNAVDLAHYEMQRAQRFAV